MAGNHLSWNHNSSNCVLLWNCKSIWPCCDSVSVFSMRSKKMKSDTTKTYIQSIYSWIMIDANLQPLRIGHGNYFCQTTAEWKWFDYYNFALYFYLIYLCRGRLNCVQSVSTLCSRGCFRSQGQSALPFDVARGTFFIWINHSDSLNWSSDCLIGNLTSWIENWYSMFIDDTIK